MNWSVRVTFGDEDYGPRCLMSFLVMLMVTRRGRRKREEFGELIQRGVCRGLGGCGYVAEERRALRTLVGIVLVEALEAM